MQRRIGILVFVCSILFAALSVSLFSMQVLSGNTYNDQAATARVREIPITGARGQLLDRYGRILAANIAEYEIVLQTSDVPPDSLNASILSALTAMRACDVALLPTIALASQNGLPVFSAADIETFLAKQELHTDLSAQDTLAALRERYSIPPSYSDADAADVIAAYLGAGGTAYASLSDSHRLVLLELAPRYGSPFLFRENGAVMLKEEAALLCPDDLLLLIQGCTALSLDSPCRSAFPISVGESGPVWNTPSVRTLRGYAKADADADAQAVLQALVARYHAEDIPGEYLLDVLAVRTALSSLGYRSYTPLVLGKSSNALLCAIVSENAESMPGISLNQTYTRSYPHGEVFCQALGYVGHITAETQEAYRALGYNIAADIVGRAGLEEVLEQYLRPGKGSRLVSVDSLGRAVSLWEETSASDGKDVVLTIDLTLQSVAEQALDKALQSIRANGYPNAYVGAAAAVDVHTGQVLALASRPGYDPNIFTDTVTQALWDQLNPAYNSQDATLPRPLVHAALQVAAPPGSTYKTITAAAALAEKQTTPYEKVTDLGRYTYYSETNAPACWTWNDTQTTHGDITLKDAIALSCNYYFYEMGTRLGIDKLEEYALKFGLGQKTGIELNETAGSVGGRSATNAVVARQAAAQVASFTGKDSLSYVDALWELLQQFSMERAYGVLQGFGLTDDQVHPIYTYMDAYRWRDSSVVASSIGQGNTNASVLQMAQVAAAVTQDGKRFRPTLLLSVPEANVSFAPEQVSEAFLTPAQGRAIREGMTAALQQGGTAYRYFQDCTVAVSGKTGTAQSEGRDAYAWFIAYAPSDKPQIAVAVMIGQGGHGSYAAPVARAIIEAYFAPGEGTPLPAKGQLLP